MALAGKRQGCRSEAALFLCRTVVVTESAYLPHQDPRFASTGPRSKKARKLNTMEKALHAMDPTFRLK